MTDLKFEKKFHVQLDDGVVTLPLRVQRWAEKRGDGLGAFVLAFVVPWLKEVWVKVKVKQTMCDVDRQAETLVDTWEQEDEKVNEPVVTITHDPESPLGIVELRATAPWVENSQE